MIILSRKIFLFFFLLILCPFIYADYERVGDNDFYGGIISPDMRAGDIATPVSYTLPSNTGTPLVSDVDGDGVFEYVALTPTSVRVLSYNETSGLIDSEATYTHGCNVSYTGMSNLAITDFNSSDSYKDIVLVCYKDHNTNEIMFLQWNTNTFNLNHTPTTTIGADLTSNFQLACDDTSANPRCFLVGDDGGLQNPSDTYGVAFNYTKLGSQVLFYSKASSYTCPPYNNFVSVAQMDDDNIKEFVFSILNYYSGNVESYVFIADVTNTLVVSEGLQFETNEPYYTGFSDCAHYLDYARVVTSPTVSDWDGDNINEFALGVMETSSTYRMYVYDTDGVQLNSFPLLARSGRILSNVFPANIIYDTIQVNDACMLAWDSTSSELDLMCGNKGSSGFDNEVFSITLNNDVNLTNNINDTHMHMMTVDASDNTVDGNDLDEILTPWGIMAPVYNSFIPFTDNTLSRIIDFETSKSGSWVGDDTDSDGYSELVYMTDSRLYYIDDTYVNRRPYTLNVTIKPCSPIKVNESIRVSFEAFDYDDNTVYANVSLYIENDNVYNFPTQNVSGATSEGAEFYFFKEYGANLTGTYRLNIRIWDNESDNPIILEYTFTVATEGNLYEDCERVIGVTPPEGTGYISESENENATTTSDVTGNALDQMTNTFYDNTGLGSTIFWLILMLMVGAGVLWGTYNYPTPMSFSLIGLTEIVMFIIGVKLGYISSGVLWTMIIFGVMVVGGLVGKRFFLQSGG